MNESDSALYHEASTTQQRMEQMFTELEEEAESHKQTRSPQSNIIAETTPTYQKAESTDSTSSGLPDLILGELQTEPVSITQQASNLEDETRQKAEQMDAELEVEAEAYNQTENQQSDVPDSNNIGEEEVASLQVQDDMSYAFKAKAVPDSLLKEISDLEWVSLEGLSKAEQRRKVAEDVYRIGVMIDRGEIDRISLENIAYLNSCWRRDKKETEKTYLDNLFSCESAFRANFEKYMNLLRYQHELEHNIQSCNNEDIILTNKKRMLENRIDNLKQWQQHNKSNLEARLASLPTSVVMLGKIKNSLNLASINVTKEMKKNVISEVLLRAAIDHVVTEKIHTSQQQTEYGSRMSINREKQGNALISDSYFKTIMHISPITNANEFFQILRLDVYPYEKTLNVAGEATSTENYQMLSDSVSSFVVDVSNNNLTFRKVPSGDILITEELALNPDEEIPFIRQLIATKDANNAEIREKMHSNIQQYDYKNCEYEDSIAAIERSIEGITAQMSKLEGKRRCAREELDRVEQEKPELREEFESTRRNYEDSYRERADIKSQYEVVDLADPDNWRIKAGRTYDAMESFRKARAETAIEISQKRTEEEENVRYSLSSKSVSYYANIIAYRILYVTTLGDPADGVINIGYKLLYSSVVETELDIEKGMFRQLVKDLEWKISSNDYHSPLNQGNPPSTGSGWRLPTLEELEALNSDIRKYFDREGVDVYAALDWKKLRFLSSDTEVGEYGEHSFWVFDSRPGQECLRQIARGDATLVIWVRPLLQE